MTTRTGGVADYFAILGLGEEIIWEHGKSECRINEDEEAELMERFYREIVEVAIHPSHPEQDETTASASGVGASTVISRNESVDGFTTIHTTCPAAKSSDLWSKSQVFEANLDPCFGFRSEILEKLPESRLRGLQRKMGNTIRNQLGFLPRHKYFHLGFRRRSPDEKDRPAISEMELHYVKIHKDTLPPLPNTPVATTTIQKGAKLAARVAEVGKQKLLQSQGRGDSGDDVGIDLKDLIQLPDGFDQWVFPEPYHHLLIPSKAKTILSPPRKTHVFPQEDVDTNPSTVGVEVNVSSLPSSAEGSWMKPSVIVTDTEYNLEVLEPSAYLPKLVSDQMIEPSDAYIFVPAVCIRRQRVSEEERFHEDTAVVEMTISFYDHKGEAVLPDLSEEEEDEDEDLTLLRLTRWSSTRSIQSGQLGMPLLLTRKNIPFGFADTPFSAKVQARFPMKNYKGLPLPEEELPMFCYPTGCRLYRARLSDSPLPQTYSFVVKNERGDSIHISCVSFFEPLAGKKVEQLNQMSLARRRVSIAHRRYCQKRKTVRKDDDTPEFDRTADNSDGILTGFESMVTFENKTICLISRYPFWTAFRRFLSHLHIMSGSSSDLPLERYISHLLISCPIPKPGGPCVLVPLPALNGPMILQLPPLKDLPLVDLPFHLLLGCMEVPTIVTVVLGFLALERKLIVMSTRPSLVTDVCELLQSLLFPFQLCAPYVPRLTKPFMSCLDFPGAIFVGIHDDGTEEGLASIVRKTMPEDSAIVHLDTGEIDCSGDRYEVLKQCWGVIPAGPRSVLVSEIETLCRDAGIVPGQEPLDSQIDSAFDATVATNPVEYLDDHGHAEQEPLDDRAVRDAFLRFFCTILGGYERYLVAPDVDFMTSGNEWFDAQGFLSGASQEAASFLGSLVTTQLFQSFIQRRTEASDVHCLLFDECLSEYHSSPVPYGRLGGDVETVHSPDDGPPQMLYSLLVDQSCAGQQQQQQQQLTDESFDIAINESMELDVPLSPSITSDHTSVTKTSGIFTNEFGDQVTYPSRADIPQNARYVYCRDGMPCFPQKLVSDLFHPTEPDSMLVELSENPSPSLARSEREIEEALRRRTAATSCRGLKNQRRCLWQLPKLMGSHFLGSWLLCIPAQVSQSSITSEQQSRYLLRALGALRLLRSRHRIIPDEASYRALMVACGRAESDRRIELVKLFGLLRSDGIFPSAVTLGQYTRALAEGYSKRATTGHDEAASGVEMTEHGHSEMNQHPTTMHELETCLCAMDRTLENLEDAGRKWRQKQGDKAASDRISRTNKSGKSIDATEQEVSLAMDKDKKRKSQQWLPVLCSTSFVPDGQRTGRIHCEKRDVTIVSMWSRTTACSECSYIPLDEEVQSGWDAAGGESSDVPGAVNCPRCGVLLTPRLGYKEIALLEARNITTEQRQEEHKELPTQLTPEISVSSDDCFVAYLSPALLRSSLEKYVEERGEDALNRDILRRHDPEVFINLWWYCARFQLPLPLPTQGPSDEIPKNMVAVLAWDKSVAGKGSTAVAQAICHRLGLDNDGPNNGSAASVHPSNGSFDSDNESPLLSRFNLKSLSQVDWDQEDLSRVLVTLVEACDKLDFLPVVECVLACRDRSRISSNDTMTTSFDNSSKSKKLLLDCYRTVLYLAKYHCTSAFHTFFPAVAKSCKGYHFWCAFGSPLPIFDRLFRDAISRIGDKDASADTQDVSDVALAFRCVFGHII